MIKMIDLEIAEKAIEKQKRKIEIINKVASKYKYEINRKSKPSKCYICGKECSSFCNSHSIPKFCLKNISKTGKVYQSLFAKPIPLFGAEDSVSNAGTFHIICNECDQRFFVDYENPQNYEKTILSDKMMAQIVAKDSLLMISKRLKEMELYKLTTERYGSNETLEIKLKVDELDYKEDVNNLKRAMIATKGNHNFYNCFYYKKLDYVVPYAIQNGIALSCDLNGNVINNTFNYSTDYKIQDLYMIIFPLKSSSIIALFIDSKAKRYREFIKQFNKLDEMDKLSVINYTAFAYSENLFISI